MRSARKRFALSRFDRFTWQCHCNSVDLGRLLKTPGCLVISRKVVCLPFREPTSPSQKLRRLLALKNALTHPMDSSKAASPCSQGRFR